jgi:hypothetical protein
MAFLLLIRVKDDVRHAKEEIAMPTLLEFDNMDGMHMVRSYPHSPAHAVRVLTAAVCDWVRVRRLMSRHGYVTGTLNQWIEEARQGMQAQLAHVSNRLTVVKGIGKEHVKKCRISVCCTDAADEMTRLPRWPWMPHQYVIPK